MDGEVLVSGGGVGPRAWAVGLCLLVAPAGLSAQAGRAAANDGTRLYEQGRFAEAHDRYLEALREAPDSPIIRFNDGNALYRGAQYESALEAYRDAIGRGDLALLPDAWYNVGNALYRRQMLQESLEAYKQALRIDPSDTDSKHNLERVLEQMREQQDPEQEPDEDQEDDPQGDQSQDQDQPQDDEPDTEAQDPPGEPPPGAGGRRPQEMSREEAERLLDAIQEDQDEVNRQPRSAARGRRPRKDW